MAERGGSVINMASIGGLVVEPSIGWYNVTKAGVIHLTHHLAVELGPSVRVTPSPRVSSRRTSPAPFGRRVRRRSQGACL